MNTHSISVLSIGSELLDGRVQDSNAAFVGAELAKLGMPLRRISSCADDLSEIKSVLAELLQHSDFVVLSGGLGPTTDDLTREAVAEFAGSNLIESAAALTDLKDFYARRSRVFNPKNLKQILIPEEAAPLRNLNGSAAGFALKLAGSKCVAALPGVPAEFRAMFSAEVLPLIKERFKSDTRIESICFRVFWLPEAEIGDRIEKLALPRDLIVSYRAAFPEVQILLKRKGALPEAAVRAVETALGMENIYSRSLALDLPVLIQELLLQRKLSLSVAESCTGGLLGKLISDVPGSSQCFCGGAITYSNQLKTALLKVSNADLTRHGAVSAEVARAMAQGARAQFGSDLALSITGIAGPDGGTPEKPVGTFFLGLADEKTVHAGRYFFASSRKNIRRFAAFCALDLLRRHLLGLPFKIDALHD